MSTMTIGNLVYRVRECLAWPGDTLGVPLEGETRELIFWPYRDTLCKGLAVPARVFMVHTAWRSGALVERYLEEDVTDQATVTSSNPNVVQWGTFGLLLAVGPGTTELRARLRYRETEYAAVMPVRVLDADDPYSCCASVSGHMLLALDLTESMTMSVGAVGRRIDAAKTLLTDLFDKINLRKNYVAAVGWTHSSIIPLQTPAAADRALLKQRIQQATLTTEKTGFGMMLDYAYSYFDALLNDPLHPAARETQIPVLVIVSDFNPTRPENSSDLRHRIQRIKDLGVKVVALAIAPTIDGALLAAAWATPGYHFRVVPNVTFSSLTDHPAYVQFRSALSGLCFGNCYAGRMTVIRPGLYYSRWQYWTCVRGTTRLLGDGYWDIMPGSGRYMDMIVFGNEKPAIWSATRYTLQANQKYTFSVICAPNNRIALSQQNADAIRIRLLKLADVPSIGNAPDPSGITVDNGDTGDPDNPVIPTETDEYAFTWMNDDGGQSLPSAAPASVQVSRRLAVVRIPLPAPSTFPSGFDKVVVWKKSGVLNQWYRLAVYDKDDTNYPAEHADAHRASALMQGVAPAMRPPVYVTAGTRTVLKERVLHMPFHASAWIEVSMQYEPASTQTDVILEIEQTQGDTQGRVGLLIESVRLFNETTGMPLLEDDFSSEGFIELPSPCVNQPNHPLCDGQGCPETVAIPAVLPMPTNVPADIELGQGGGSESTSTYRAEATGCATCRTAQQDLQPFTMPPGPGSGDDIEEVHAQLLRQPIQPQQVTIVDCNAGPPPPPPSDDLGESHTIAVPFGGYVIRYVDNVGHLALHYEDVGADTVPNTVWGEYRQPGQEYRGFATIPLPAFQQSGTYRIRVRLWGLVEARVLTVKNTGNGILDFQQAYLTPILYDPYAERKLRISLTGNDAFPPGWRWYWGNVGAENWITWSGPAGQWITFPWGPDMWGHHTTQHHGHPNFHAGALNPLEQAYQSGSGQHADLGGCAAVRSWAPIWHAKLDPSLWGLSGMHSAIRAFASAGIGFNLYMISLYDLQADQPVEVWTANTVRMPISSSSQDPAAHPTLVIPELNNLIQHSMLGRGLLQEYGISGQDMMQLLTSRFPLCLVDTVFEFTVTANPSSQLAIRLCVSTSDAGSAIGWPYAKSQCLAHLMRWHVLKNQPSHQNTAFAQYLKKPGRPEDWLWPHSAPGSLYNPEWYQYTIDPALVGLAIQAQSAAGNVDGWEVSRWECTQWNGSGGHPEGCEEHSAFIPGHGADTYATFMQSLHIKNIDVELIS